MNMHPLKVIEYQSKFMATVKFSGGNFEVLGGRPDKVRLNTAKTESNFCYVKDIHTNDGVKLILSQGNWVPEQDLSPTAPPSSNEA